MPSDGDYAAMAYGRGNRDPLTISYVEAAIQEEYAAMNERETWSLITRLERGGDSLYKSSTGRYLVACEKPGELEGGVEAYILDIERLRRGEVCISEFGSTGHYLGFPRVDSYPIYETKEAAWNLHRALHKEGVMPAKVMFSIESNVGDVE